MLAYDCSRVDVDLDNGADVSSDDVNDSDYSVDSNYLDSDAVFDDGDSGDNEDEDYDE